MASTSKTIKIEPIETAEIRQGEATEQRWIWPGAEGVWTKGHHDGRAFFDDYTDTEIPMPKYWARFPSEADLTDC